MYIFVIEVDEHVYVCLYFKSTYDILLIHKEWLINGGINITWVRMQTQLVDSFAL